MDYRYYRGEGIALPPIVTKNLHWLRYIGAVMIASPPLLGLMMVLDLFDLSLFWFFASFLLGSFGNVFFVIGMTYDTILDKGNPKVIQRWRKLFGRNQEPQEFRPERRMIYEHYEAPELIKVVDNIEKEKGLDQA